MALVTHENCKLELRLDDKGRITPYWDGVFMSGVRLVKIEGSPGHSGEAHIVFPSRCFTMTTVKAGTDG